MHPHPALSQGERVLKPLLLNSPPQADRFFDVQILARLEADFLGAIDNIEPAGPLHIARLAAQLLAQHVTIGVGAVIESEGADRCRITVIEVPAEMGTNSFSKSARICIWI